MALYGRGIIIMARLVETAFGRGIVVVFVAWLVDANFKIALVVVVLKTVLAILGDDI